MRPFEGKCNPDDILLFGDGRVLFGSAVQYYAKGTIKHIITPDDEEYWDYFFDIEE